MQRDDARLDGSATGMREIDRRTIAKGVAWTVPAVIVATAAPAAAGSMDVHLDSAAALGSASGINDYQIMFGFQSHGVTGTVSITGVAESGAWSTTTGSTTIGANGTAQITLLKKKNRAASTPLVTFTYTATGGAPKVPPAQGVAVPKTPA